MPSKTGKKHILANDYPQKQRPTQAKGDAPRPAAKRSATNLQASKRPATNKPTSQRRAPPKPPQKAYMIWGRHAVFAALQNNERRVAQIYTASDYGETDLHSYLSALPPERRNNLPPIQRIKRERLETLAGPYKKAVHQGLAAAVWPVEPPHFEDFLALHQNAPLRLILLDHVSDPHNVGAIMRSARAFGVAAVITTFHHAAEENGALARAASGALDHLYYMRVTNLSRTIERLQQDHITVAGLAGDGDMTVASLSGINRLAFVLGAEGSGIRRLTRDHCDHLVRIDIENQDDSLNVSNAAAIALYATSTPPNT
jgi:23S rRNA (guanosine2251-2'-O)-methyltransferase